MGIEVIGPPPAGDKTLKIEKFTSTTSWTAPDDVQAVDVILVGGGGGGFGHSNNTSDDYERMSGGGGGGVVRQSLSVTPGSTYTIEVGAGGAARSINNNNLDDEFYAFPGGSTNFGNLAKAGGGLGSMSYDNFSQVYGYINNNTGPSWFSLNEVYGSAGGNNEGGRNNAANPDYIGGGGGGAGSPAMASADRVYSYIYYNANNVQGPLPTGTFPLFRFQSQGNQGGQAGAYDDERVSTGAGGLGTSEGWGAGGSGGTEYTNWGAMARFKASGNGGQGAIAREEIPANAGAINTGAGGGGGARSGNSNDFKMDGGAGGSGLAIIKYWTAE